MTGASAPASTESETLMPTLNETTTGTPIESRRRRSLAAVSGITALVLAPAAGWAGATAEFVALGGADATSDQEGFLAAIAANSALWNTFGVLMLAMALLTAAWVPAVWRHSVDRTPRWAWAAAIVGTLFALGQMVHLVSWVVLNAALATSVEASEALAVVEAIESSWFFGLIFVPYLLGAVLAPPLAAVALRRARFIPTWAMVVVMAASVAGFILGTDNPIGVAVYSVLLITGFTPAVVRVLRGRGV